jgi:hypothetical protein
MPTTPKPLAKNLPVLTEVVDPATLSLLPQTQGEVHVHDTTTRIEPGLFATPAVPVIDKEKMVADITRSLLPRLEQQLRTSLLALVENQLNLHTTRMREDVEAAVQVAVDKVITGESS